jgi:hypothetical protein
MKKFDLEPDRISQSSSETPLIIRSESVQSTPSSTEKVEKHEGLKQKIAILQNILTNLSTDQRNDLRTKLERRIKLDLKNGTGQAILTENNAKIAGAIISLGIPINKSSTYYSVVSDIEQKLQYFNNKRKVNKQK